MKIRRFGGMPLSGGEAYSMEKPTLVVRASSRMPVVVTGGAGYIGSHTAKALAYSGFEPVVLDNLSLGHGGAVKWGPLVKGDLVDAALIREVIATHKVRAVIHFAANAYVGE